MRGLTGSERARLRAMAHGLKPLVQVGREGVTETQIENIDRALEDHELIKVRFLGRKEEKRELSGEISERTGSELVGLIGNVAILYRESLDPSKRRIKLSG
jgi:RNA-binding protein